VDWLAALRRCFNAGQALYSGHARREMREEEFGPISEQEVYEALASGEVVEEYPDDDPYPSVLVLGFTSGRRPLHLVCAYSAAEDLAVVVTVYQPDPEQWEEYRRRR
jgi:hypothetical protein